MANGFNTEVLRRSLGRNPRTLLEFADLPQVQPGPSQGAMIADMASQTIKGIGQQILQSKKLDLDAQRTAAQIGIAQDTHDLNVREQDYEESTSSDLQVIENIKDSNFNLSLDTIGKFSDTTQGRNLRDIYTKAHANLKPAYDKKEAFEEFLEGGTIVELLAEEGGRERFDEYTSLDLKDKRFNLGRNPGSIDKVAEYNKNRRYYDLVSNEENFKRTFGLLDEEYLLFKGLEAKEGQDLIVLKLKSRTGLDENSIRSTLGMLTALQSDISNTERTISNLQSRIDDTPTTNLEKQDAMRQIKAAEARIKLRRQEYDRLSKGFRTGGAPKNLARTERIQYAGNIYDVNYDASGNQIGERTLIGPVTPEPDDSTGVVSDTAGVVSDTAGVVSDTTDVKTDQPAPDKTSKILNSFRTLLTRDEQKQVSSKLKAIWTREGKPLDSGGMMKPNFDHPNIVAMLKRFGYYDKYTASLNSSSGSDTLLSPPQVLP